jgi:hypothetical protein
MSSEEPEKKQKKKKNRKKKNIKYRWVGLKSYPSMWIVAFEPLSNFCVSLYYVI